MNAPPYIGLRALGGEPLEGRNPVRMVFLDEAGYSAHEPFAVRAGVIVHADEQWRPVQERLNALAADLSLMIRCSSSTPQTSYTVQEISLASATASRSA